MFISDEVAFALYPVGLTFYLPVDFAHFIFNIPEGLPCDMSWCNGLDTQSSAQSHCSRSWIRLACSAGGLWGKRDSSHPKDTRKTADSIFIHSPFSSAQKGSFCAVVFSRLMSALFSIEEEEEEYVRPSPRTPCPPRCSAHLQVCFGLTWLVVHELSEPSCFLILHSFLKTWWKTVTRAQRYTCINIYVDELKGRYVHPVFPPLL